jgi:hypothetical protein
MLDFGAVASAHAFSTSLNPLDASSRLSRFTAASSLGAFIAPQMARRFRSAMLSVTFCNPQHIPRRAKAPQHVPMLVTHLCGGGRRQREGRHSCPARSSPMSM